MVDRHSEPVQRIEAGTLRGRKLLALPRGVDGLRPTGARIRGAIFDRLQTEVVGARVLDLFAGSGALSFEALSRGAESAWLIERDPRVVRHLQRQAEALGVGARCRITRHEAQALVGAQPPAGPAFDLVFVDPPFATPEVFAPIAAGLVAHGWLAPHAIVVCESERVRGKTLAVPWPPELVVERARAYGQAHLELLRLRRAATPETTVTSDSTVSTEANAKPASAPPISARAAKIKPSATLAVSGRAKELKAEGKQVLSFAAGEPDFKPPAAVRETVIRLARDERCGYAPVPGIPALRDAVAAELSRVHGREFSRGEILVSCGAKHSAANLFLATCDPGDEVVFPAPFWVSYPDMAGLAGAVPVVVPTTAADGFRVQADALEAALTDKTKIVLLNSPNNPTGVGLRASDLRALGEAIARKAPQAWLVVDDIYRDLVYDGYEHPSAIRTLKDVHENIIVIDGVSKTYAMTGFRIGFLAAPTSIVSAASRIQSQTTSGAATHSQHAALAALTDPSVAADVAQMKEAFTRRRSLILDLLSQIEGVSAPAPDGAFYAFADVSRYVGPGTRFEDDVKLATWLLEEKLVAAVPGTPFGGPGNLRLSYATDDDTIREGLSRMRDAFASLAT